MKLIRTSSLFACLLITATFVSCVEDDEGFIIERNAENSDIFGVVTDSQSQPISGALVTFNGEMELTDEDGVYRFNDVAVGPQHNALKIEMDGYFESTRTFRTAVSGVQYQTTILHEKTFSHSFDSDIVGNVEEDQVSIRFPANSVVYDDSGERYDGEVLVAIVPIDPSEEQLAERMPGDLSAIEEDETISTLESFGMVYVELQSPSGRKLQIAENQNVELSYEVSQEFLDTAPQTIDMWSFDFDRGVWVKEGQATLEEEIYTGIVNHFSCWNYDVSAPSVVVSGQIVSNLGALSYLQVSLINADNKGGRGSTDEQGRFSGRVEADVELTLRLRTYGQCNEIIIYEEEVGPFSTDTDLGVIMIEMDIPEILSLSGTALDCESNLLDQGKIFVGNFVFPITNGNLDVITPVCADLPTIDIRVVDVNGLQQVVLTDIPTSGEVDLATVFVCGEDAFHLTVDNLKDEPIVFTDIMSSNLYSEVTDQSRVMISVNIDTIPFANLSFTVGDGRIEQIEVGSYRFINASFVGRSESFSGEQTVTDTVVGSVDINSVRGDNLSQIISGSYSVRTNSRNTNEVRVITGSFNTQVSN